MKIFSKAILMSSAGLWAVPSFLCLSFNSAYASLTSINQNQAFESEPRAAISSMRPASPFTKLASVYFITGNDGLDFEGQEFKTDDVCVTAGYTFKGCPSGYIAVDPCPDDGSYYKNCIDKSTWCQNNGYNITSCQVPEYPTTQCPYDASYYKTCETDNIKACKELGYSLTCETGKVGDTGDVCPYNSSYKKCICNPCTGYDYTASEATEQGYTMGESCNSCGTLKYKRTANACEGYLECKEGGASGAKVCYSGSIKKFSECKEVCDSKYKYDSTNCPSGYTLGGGSCGGKYESCTAPCGSQYVYDSSNCPSGYTLSGSSCGGKYESCVIDCTKKAETHDKSSVIYGTSPGTCSRNWGLDFDSLNTYANYNLASDEKFFTLEFTYAGKKVTQNVPYFVPSTTQNSSKEVVVSNCDEFVKAWNDESIFNIRINGHITCSSANGSLYGKGAKHVYGKDKTKDIWEIGDFISVYMTHLKLSNLTVKKLKTSGSIINSSVFINAENLDIWGGSDLASYIDIIYLSGTNETYIKGTCTGPGYESFGNGRTIVGPNASYAVRNEQNCSKKLFYNGFYLLGSYSGDSITSNDIYIEGSNKSIPHYGNGTHALTNGKIYCKYLYGAEGICVLGDNSTASVGISRALAVGNNSQMTINDVFSSTYFNVALGKNACVSGAVNICSNSNYNGNYTFFTTYDINNFK